MQRAIAESRPTAETWSRTRQPPSARNSPATSGATHLLQAEGRAVRCALNTKVSIGVRALKHGLGAAPIRGGVERDAVNHGGDLATEGINVSLVMPGIFDTEGLVGATATNGEVNEGAMPSSAANVTTPLKPDAVVDTIAFMLGPPEDVYINELVLESRQEPLPVQLQHTDTTIGGVDVAAGTIIMLASLGQQSRLPKVRQSASVPTRPP